jgi:hypothetical protein
MDADKFVSPHDKGWELMMTKFHDYTNVRP